MTKAEESLIGVAILMLDGAQSSLCRVEEALDAAPKVHQAAEEPEYIKAARKEILEAKDYIAQVLASAKKAQAELDDQLAIK